MPRTAGASIPKYRKHRASGQAVVVIAGVDHYLGPHGTKTSLAEYDRLVAEWMANGRQSQVTANDALTVSELMRRYRQHVVVHHVKNGRPTSEQHSIACAMRFARQLYGQTLAASLGPLALKAIRQKMVDAGHARSTVNANVRRIRRMFRWGVENELLPPSVLQALEAVTALLSGKTEARDTDPVRPVSDAVVEATLPRLSAVVADMVRFQRLTGCRPQEVCLVRPCDVDPKADVWIYVPVEHKTQHHGKQRTIFIGPKAQDVLRQYLLRSKDAYCFCPTDSERTRLTIRHAARRVPLGYGNPPGTNRVRRKPGRTPGNRYNTCSYRRAITRACEQALGMPVELRYPTRQLLKLPPEKRDIERQRRMKLAAEWRYEHCWSPNQLRHSAATELRRRFGLEAAQVVLGHSSADVTQIYAERDMAKAAAVIREVG